jgi:hypothetical protein
LKLISETASLGVLVTTVDTDRRSNRLGALVRRAVPNTYPLTNEEWRTLKKVGIATTAFVFSATALGAWLLGLL